MCFVTLVRNFRTSIRRDNTRERPCPDELADRNERARGVQTQVLFGIYSSYCKRSVGNRLILTPHRANDRGIAKINVLTNYSKIRGAAHTHTHTHKHSSPSCSLKSPEICWSLYRIRCIPGSPTSSHPV